MIQFYGNPSSQKKERRFVQCLLSVSGLANWIVIILFLKNNYVLYPTLATTLACLHFFFQIIYSAKFKKIFILLEALGLDLILGFIPYKFYPKNADADIDFNMSICKQIFRGPLMTVLQFTYLAASFEQLSESILYSLFLISLILNATVSAHCVYLFLNQDQAGNLTYCFDQLFSIIVQSFQYLSIIYLCILNDQQNLILIAQILILVVFTLYSIFSQNHAFFNSFRTSQKIVLMTFTAWFGFPVSFAPFFKFGNIKYGWIDVSKQRTAFLVHTNLSHFVHRLVCYCQELSLLIRFVANKVQQENQEDYDIQDQYLVRQVFFFSMVFFSLNTIMSVPYFIRITKQIATQQFEYLYLKQASQQQITALTKNYQSIKILVINELQQSNQDLDHNNIQGNRRYQRLNTIDDFQTNLIHLVQHKFDVYKQVQISIGNDIFEMIGEQVTMNSNIFGDQFLEMIKTCNILPFRQICLTGQRCQTKEFADKLHKCIIEQLFKYGTGNHLSFKIALRQKTQDAIQFFMGNYMQIWGYRKMIAQYMTVNPQQVLYDLYEN